MKRKTLQLILLTGIYMACLSPVTGIAQLLNNTSWRAVGDLAIALDNNGIDTLTMTFLPNNRMEFRYFANNTNSTSYGLWWQQAPGYFKFADTSTSGVSLLCNADDSAYVQYTIDTGVMHFANMQDSCGTRGALFTDSKWRLVDNNVSVGEAMETAPSVRIWPNPSIGKLYVQADRRTDELAEIRVYDHCGQNVLSLPATGSVTEITLTSWPPGLYMIRVYSGTGTPTLYKVMLVH